MSDPIQWGCASGCVYLGFSGSHRLWLHVSIQQLFLLLNLSSALWGLQARRPFFPPYLVGKTPAIMTFPSSKGQIWTVAKQGRGSRETTWGKIKGPREAPQGEETTWDPAHMLVLSETPINSWLTVVKPSSSLEWRHMAFWGRSPACPTLPGKAIKQFFPPSWKTSSPGFDSAPV